MNVGRAVFSGKCPRCRKGDIFAYPIRNLSKFNQMNNRCPNCGATLEPEPGFYQGAMYVGYGFTVAIIILVSIVLYVFGNPSEWVYIGVVVALMILLVPLNYRYSRIIYLYLFGGIKFDASRS
ncbi:MAG TPA: DUF983 domain-containing protein [Cyclobacteriaceae bacterium]|nr:DUF983 domain-containing protein [Cyclobacteriaceae bacterium]